MNNLDFCQDCGTMVFINNEGEIKCSGCGQIRKLEGFVGISVAQNRYCLDLELESSITFSEPRLPPQVSNFQYILIPTFKVTFNSGLWTFRKMRNCQYYCLFDYFLLNWFFFLKDGNASTKSEIDLPCPKCNYPKLSFYTMQLRLFCFGQNIDCWYGWFF